MTIKIASDIQTIIWDLDGTLLDSFSVYQDCLNKVLRGHGRPEVSEQIYRNNHHGFIEDAIVGVLNEANQKYTEEELARIIHDFYKLDNAAISEVNSYIFTDAIRLAEHAHQSGKRQIIVTNRPHGINRGNGSPRTLIANSSMRALFSAIICGDDSQHKKPHRKILEKHFGPSLAELGKAIVIGDQFVDAEFARNIGCGAILVTRTTEIAHLAQLKDWQNHTHIVPSLDNVQLSSTEHPSL